MIVLVSLKFTREFLFLLFDCAFIFEEFAVSVGLLALNALDFLPDLADPLFQIRDLNFGRAVDGKVFQGFPCEDFQLGE